MLCGTACSQPALTMPHAHQAPTQPALTLPPAQARELGAAFARAKDLPAEMPNPNPNPNPHPNQELPAEMPLELVRAGAEPDLFWRYFVNGWCAGAASRTAGTLGPLDPPCCNPLPACPARVMMGDGDASAPTLCAADARGAGGADGGASLEVFEELFEGSLKRLI